MVIDFRVRPPWKSFKNLRVLRRWAEPPTQEALMPPTGFRRKPVPSVEQGDIDLMIREMDEAGVDLAVIMGRESCGTGIGSVPNDEVHELVQRYPGRLLPFAGVDPYNPQAPQEIERCVTKMGFRGVSIDPGWCEPPLYPDDPCITPIYEKVNALGVIMVINCSSMLGPDLTYSNPIAIQRVANRYPNMKIVISHGSWPHFDMAVAVAAVCPNVYIAPDCYLYVENMPMGDELVKAANTFLKHKLLFSTSYPIRGFAQAIETWSMRHFAPDALKLSLRDNAAQLLGL